MAWIAHRMYIYTVGRSVKWATVFRRSVRMRIFWNHERIDYICTNPQPGRGSSWAGTFCLVSCYSSQQYSRQYVVCSIYHRCRKSVERPPLDRDARYIFSVFYMYRLWRLLGMPQRTTTPPPFLHLPEYALVRLSPQVRSALGLDLRKAMIARSS